MPSQGWDPDAGWEEDPVPFDDMPHLASPESGYIASANNQPLPAGEGPFLGVDWMEGYRQARIVEESDARRDWDLAGVAALQMDQLSLPWRDIRESVLSTPAVSDDVRQALDLLGDWDGVVGTDSPGATVFELFLSEMVRRVVEARAPLTWEWAMGKGFTPLVPRTGFGFRQIGRLTRLLSEQPEGWLHRSWPEEVADALSATIRILKNDYGEDPRDWAWGCVRPITLRHPAGERWPLNWIYNRGPFPWGGDGNTVGQGAADLVNPTANPVFTASLRMIVDVGNWDESLFVLPGGVSGNPLSPHYDDQIPLWRRGKGVQLAWTADQVARVTRSTLRLNPMRSGK